MKKMLALVLALALLFLTGAAMAENPSKGGGDFNGGTKDDQTNFVFDFSDKEELIAWANDELAKLAEAESIQAYFTQADAIAAILGDPDYIVDELWPVYAVNYEESMGEQEIKLAFATPYEKDTAVAVMLGFKNGEDADGKPIVEWSAFSGKVLDDSVVAFMLDPETILHVQADNALLAVVNK